MNISFPNVVYRVHTNSWQGLLCVFFVVKSHDTLLQINAILRKNNQNFYIVPITRLYLVILIVTSTCQTLETIYNILCEYNLDFVRC